MRIRDLYWHLKESRWIYLTVLCVFPLIVFVIWSQYKMNDIREANLRKIKERPLVEAKILEEKISAVNSGHSKNPGMTYYVTLEVEYEYGGRFIRTKVRGSWGHGINVDANQFFQKGKTVPLRVNPVEPEKASLVELTGNL